MESVQPSPSLTSTTAPGKTFASRSEIAEHYKSDWHRYNLKRREAGLPMLKEEDFAKRLEAALALRRERDRREERSGTGHLKAGKKKKACGGKKERREAKHAAKAMAAAADDSDVALAEGGMASAISTSADGNDLPNEMDDGELRGQEGQHEEEELPTIDPCQSLFDQHIAPSVKSNLDRMNKKYGFFVPDMEYLTDLEGFLGYCQEKIKLGHYCLYCQKIYKTWSACQKHMIDSRHCKVRYERNVDQEEFDVFYDFSEADAEFLGTTATEPTNEGAFGLGHAAAARDGQDEVMREGNDGDDDDSGEWEDISDDEAEAMDDADGEEEFDEEDLYEGYESEIRTHGFDITPLGELVFPDGRIVGHRGLSRYYKQRFAPDSGERAAVQAARRAAGERVYGGRVLSIRQGGGGGGVGNGGSEGEANRLALAKAGVVAGAAAGRAGKGILVPVPGSSGGNFTALSLYRYRATVRKARRDESKGWRQQQRTKNNINRMDKKANRLMNGVSVAHAAR